MWPWQNKQLALWPHIKKVQFQPEEGSVCVFACSLLTYGGCLWALCFHHQHHNTCGVNSPVIAFYHCGGLDMDLVPKLVKATGAAHSFSCFK